MEKEQPDSLATVTVGTKDMQMQSHHGSHYAPSEVYSSAEPPPAYMRPNGKSTPIEIAKIAAVTLIAMSVVLGCFILASSYVQARASCTPEAIAAMEAEMRLTIRDHQQQQRAFESRQFVEHLKPEPLIREGSLVEVGNEIKASTNKAIIDTTVSETKETRDSNEAKTTKKTNEVVEDEDREDDDEDDYEDEDEFPPIRIELPLRLDLDDIAGMSLGQESSHRVTCVVERRRSEESSVGTSNKTESERFQIPGNGERVVISCESAEIDNPQQQRQQQQQQGDYRRTETINPILIPLMRTNYAQYHRFEPQREIPLTETMIVGGGFPIPMEMMRPPRPNEEPNLVRTSPIIPPRRFVTETVGTMMPPPPPPPPSASRVRQMETRRVAYPQFFNFGSNSMRQEIERDPGLLAAEHRETSMEPEQSSLRTIPMFRPEIPMRSVVPNGDQQRRGSIRVSEEKEQREERPSPFQDIPIEIRRIIQQVPLEIKNMIEHMTSDTGSIREVVGESKPIPDSIRPMSLDAFPLPIEIRNLLEHGNIGGNSEESREGRQQHQQQQQQQQQRQQQRFSGMEEDGSEEIDRDFSVPLEVRNFIHQVVEGRAFPVTRFPVGLNEQLSDNIDVPLEARVRVTEDRSELTHQQQQQQQQQQPRGSPLVLEAHPESQSETEAQMRPHYVQPRSIRAERSIPEPFAHRREKRARRCACDCLC